MKVYLRWNRDALHRDNKCWRVIFDNSEIICDEVELFPPLKTEIVELPDKGPRSHIYIEAKEVIYKDGKVSFKI